MLGKPRVVLLASVTARGGKHDGWTSPGAGGEAGRAGGCHPPPALRRTRAPTSSATGNECLRRVCTGTFLVGIDSAVPLVCTGPLPGRATNVGAGGGGLASQQVRGTEGRDGGLSPACVLRVNSRWNDILSLNYELIYERSSAASGGGCSRVGAGALGRDVKKALRAWPRREASESLDRSHSSPPRA